MSRRGGLIQRLFAWTTAHQDTYEASMAARKRMLFGGLHGAVLEIGPGAGSNLRFYPADVRWVGVEPNPFMHPYLLQSIRELHRPAEAFSIDPGDPRGYPPAGRRREHRRCRQHPGALLRT